MATRPFIPMVGWYLEGSGGEDRATLRVPLLGFPFPIGRRRGQAMQLWSDRVSGAHAEIDHTGAALVVRDLGSTNGTFVNLKRITREAEIRPGDVLHFADLAFTLIFESDQDSLVRTLVTTALDGPALASRLADCALAVAYQPLVSLDGSGRTHGYEALARCELHGRPASPLRVFELAADHEAELSRRLRDIALDQALELPGQPKIFVNTHPRELEGPDLLESLIAARQRHPDLAIVLEIHEEAVTEPKRMAALVQGLHEVGVDLAYDDFGAGQARMLELVDTAPRYVKFDRSLLTQLHLGPARRIQFVETLVRMVRDLGIVPIAEGIETKEEAEICTQIGFAQAQGWHFGRPLAAAVHASRVIVPED